MLAKTYPTNSETIISIPIETGEETNQHLSIITTKRIVEKMTVNMAIIMFYAALGGVAELLIARHFASNSFLEMVMIGLITFPLTVIAVQTFLIMLI